MKFSTDLLARAAFVASVATFALVYGSVAAVREWFPGPQIRLAYNTVIDISTYWENDLGLEPSRHLVSPGGDPAPERGYRRMPGAAPEPGYVLVTGLSDDQQTSVHVVRMFAQNGEEVYRWPIYYDRFDKEKNPRNVMLHGMEVFEDGSLAVTFDAGNAIARIDACGKPIWSVNGNFHHSITRDGEGGLITWRDETIVRLDEKTGEELSTLDVRRDIVPAAGGEQRGYFDMRTVMPEKPGGPMTYLTDPFHPNDAEALRADMAAAFPMFEAGDILFSLREINMIAVVDPKTGRMKWWRHGPWNKQHDPDFQPDGTITVFDNATGTGRSLIRRINPANNRVSTVFSGGEEIPFYSWRRGKHQVLPGGNLLLTEAERGRVLEIDPSGRLVWERDMRWDADYNLIVTEARQVPEKFFANGVPRCNSF